MTRLDGLSDNLLVTTIRELREDRDTLKSSQRVGAPNVKVYRNDSGASYDKTLTIGAYGTAGFTLIFTANQQKYAKATVTYRMYIGSMSTEVRLGDYTPNVAPDLKIYPQIYSDSQPLATKWIFTLTNNEASSRTYFFKFGVQATDTGVITTI